MPEAPFCPPRPVCPHCGKEIPRLIRAPRDLGLLLNCLLYRVPPEEEITEGWIERFRLHCRMKPERLAELRGKPFARFWQRIAVRRAARLAYFKQHGEFPPSWKGLLPGEPDHQERLEGARRYRKSGLPQLKAKLRRNPDKPFNELMQRYAATGRIRSWRRRAAALDVVGARIKALVGMQLGTLTLREFEALKRVVMAEKELYKRRRKWTAPAPGATGHEPPKP